MGPKSSSKIRYLLVILQPFSKLKKIKHIIFDLGGVILNIDYHLTVAAFKKIKTKFLMILKLEKFLKVCFWKILET